MLIILIFKEPRKRSSGENTYMTVQSASEDLTSSDDVYSSVPESRDNIEGLGERRYNNQRKEKLGPLPAVPNGHPKDRNNNSKHNKQERNAAGDENDDLTKDRETSNVKPGSLCNKVLNDIMRVKLYTS